MRLAIPRIPALILFLSLLALSTGTAFAQSATLRGFVTDASDGQSIPGVNVILTNAAGDLYGTATDTDGFYAISRVPPGTYTVRATYIGYADFEQELTLEAGQRTLNFELGEDEAILDEVIVESERETAGAAAITAGLQTVRAADIELVPAPDISADLVNYLTALPGIVSQGDRGGQLFIRGGEPTQNLVLLDGIPIYQPFHVVGFFSAFPSEIINTADVYAGGYGSRFGGRLASVLDISARTGNNRQLAGAVSLAPFVSTARLEGPIVPGRVSFMASVRESVIEQGAERLVDEPLPFAFGDRFAKLHARLGQSAQVSITALNTDDTGRLGVDPNAEDPNDFTRQEEVNWQNEAYGMRFIFLPASLPIFAEILASNSRLTNEFGLPDDPFRTTEVEQFNFNTNVTLYAGNADYNWGLFLTSTRLESDLGGQFQNVDVKEEFVTEAGLYMEPEFRLGYGLRVQPGVRLQTFPSKGQTFLEPRFRLVWDLGIHRISGAAGLYHQQIVGLNDRRDAGDVFTAWSSSPFGSVPAAWHFIAGYRAEPTGWLAMSLEGFYKDMNNLVVPEWTAFPRFTTSIQTADGNALGMDARVEIVAGETFYGAVSYGLSNVEYETDIPALTIQTGNELTEYQPPHDRRHQLSVITSVKQWGFDLSVRYQFGSGLPFNQSLGFDRFILVDTLVAVTENPGEERVLYSSPYGGRLPNYHRIDVSLDRTFQFTKRASATFQLGVINAGDRRNLFYLDLFTLRRVNQLPLIPTFGMKVQLE